MRKELLEYSYKHNLGHIPSSLSMIDYLEVVFEHVTRDNFIIIGKPFGAQAYYVLWKQLGWIDDIDSLSAGVKHDEIDFVDYSEETIGNALGIAAGIALTTEQKIYVNLSDGALQMGNILEAIQYIGKNRGNILLTVDYNNMQVTGKCSDIIPVDPVINFFRDNNWNTYIVDGHNKDELRSTMSTCFHFKSPTVIFCKTVKGKGVPVMEHDNKWHYGKLNETNFTQIINSIKE